MMSALSPKSAAGGTPRLTLCLSAVLLTLSLGSGDAFAQTSNPTDGTTPQALAPGAPAGSYGLSGFESVNLYSGNLNFKLPLVRLGGRGEASATLALSIDSVKWTTDKEEIRDGCDYGESNHGPHPTYECLGPVVQTVYAPGVEGWQGIRPGYGPGVLQGRRAGAGGGEGMLYARTLTRLTFTASDGTQYELRDAQTGGMPATTGVTTPQEFSRGRVFVTADGSGVTFVSDDEIKDTNSKAAARLLVYPSGYLLLPNGARYHITEGVVTSIRDRNGNYLTFSYDASKRLVSAVDQLGREVTVTYADLSTRFYDELSFKGFGGAARSIKVWRGHLRDALRSGSVQTYAALFPELDGADNNNFDPNDVAQAVELPDGRRYTLRYNRYGELSRVVLPTGGAVEYDYTQGSGVVGTQVYRRVVERRDSPTGATGAAMEHRQTFDAVYSGVSDAQPWETTVTAREYGAGPAPLAAARHRFGGSPAASLQQSSLVSSSSLSYAPWGESRELTTEALDPALPADNPAAALRRVENTWRQREAVGWWAGTADGEPANDPRLVTTVTTVEPAGANLVSKRTAINPQTQAVGFDIYNNQTDVWEYDYGAGAPPPRPLRHTHTDYLTTNNGTDYTSHNGPHLRGLPAARQVYAVNPVTGEETLAAKSETRYDWVSHPLLECDPDGLVACASVPHWEEPGAARGNATTVRNWLDTGDTWLETHAQYDRLGNVRLSWDARGKVSRVTYSDSFCNDGGARCGGAFAANAFAFPTETQTPKPDPAGAHGSASELSSSTVYDFHTGLVYSSTDANGRTTRFEYEGQANKLDRVKAVVRPDGGRTDLHYGDAAGNLYVRTLSDLDAGRRTESYRFFDGLGRPVRSFVNEGGSPVRFITADTQYDALGRAWRTSAPYRTGGSGDAVNPSGRWAETSFDVLGRAVEVKTSDGAKVTTGYRGNRVLVTDQAGKQRLSVADALGRLKEVWEVTPDDPAKYPGVGPLPPAVTDGLRGAAHGYRTDYFYDALDNLRRAQQGGQARFFSYDSLGRIVRARNPEQGVFTAGGDFPALTDSTSGVSNGQWSAGYLYDENGNPSKRIDARGATATYAYDALNRNVAVSYTEAGGAAATPDVRRFYDNPAAGANGLGRLWKSEALGVALTAFDKYDEAGRPKERTQKFGVGGGWEQSQAYTTKLDYNLAGGVNTLTYPSQHKVEYRYDGANRLGDHGQLPAFEGDLGDGVLRTYASQVVYDELGGVSQERFGTQTPVYNKRLYNSRGQLGEIRVSTHPLTSADQSLRTDYNRGAIINHYSDAQGAWGASGGGPDNNGNLLRQEVHVPASGQPGSGPLNLVQRYVYDALNRLASVEERVGGATPSFAQSYQYDRWGNRTLDGLGTYEAQASEPPSVWVNEAQYEKADLPNTNRLYAPGDMSLPAGQRHMRYDGAGNLTHDAYTGGGARIYDAENRIVSAQFFSGQTQTALYSYDADGQRVKRVVGAGGQVWHVYGPDGRLLAEYAPNAPPATPQKEYGYRGDELLVTATPGASQQPQQRVNVALASNGATAAASSQLGASFPASSAINGDRHHLTSGGVYNEWHSAAGAPKPDWLEVTFAGARSINEISVFTQQDDYNNPSDPTEQTQFTLYGLRDFHVQYWTGSQWANVPGGSVTGNDKVWRKFTFPAVTTTRVRVLVSATADGHSRVFELEAWEAAPEVYLSDLQWSHAQGDYYATTKDLSVDGTPVTLNGVTYQKGLGVHASSEVRYALGGAYATFLADVGVDDAATTQGSVVFEVWADGAKLYDSGVMTPATATRSVNVGVAGRQELRLVVTQAGDGPAWDHADWAAARLLRAAAGPADVRWLVSDHLGTPRIVLDETGGLPGVTRHDYLPFGEEVGAGVGGRTQGRGYAADNVRQKFTDKERDGETNLDYFRARYYLSTQGRFTSADPIFLKADRLQDPQRLNLYTYARNNPLLYIDPTGEDIHVKVTNTRIGETTIKSRTASEIKSDQAAGRTVVRERRVPIYRVEVTNDSGSSFTFGATRDSLHDNADGSADSPARGNYGRNGEAPPGNYSGRWLTSPNTGLSLRIYDPTIKGDSTINGPDGERVAIQVHAGNCSMGCPLVRGSTMQQVKDQMDALQQEDRKNNLGTAIHVNVEDRNNPGDDFHVPETTNGTIFVTPSPRTPQQPTPRP